MGRIQAIAYKFSAWRDFSGEHHSLHRNAKRGSRLVEDDRVGLLGAQGSGKGIVARTFGKLFGKHFAHIANGDQLTGRFNASLATSCAVFLDEALWAGDRKSEGALKALITEPRLQLEAKFRDPIMVENRLRIIAASNNDWMVPAGIGDRRWFILNVADTYAGTKHRDYWDALYAEVDNGGAAAMLYDLLAKNLSEFDVRAVPYTAAKAQQQALSLHDTEAWLYHILQEGAFDIHKWDIVDLREWQEDGLVITTADAYQCYEDFSRKQRAWRPQVKAEWSKKIRKVLCSFVRNTRPKEGRSFQFAPLAECRRQFQKYVGTPIEWEPEHETPALASAQSTAEHIGEPTELDKLLDNTLQRPALAREEN